MKIIALLAASVLILITYLIVFGLKSRIGRVRRLGSWLTGDGLRTVGYLVPFFYTVTIIYFLYLFDSSCAAKYLGHAHRLLCRILYLVPISSMALCVFSDPGYIKQESHARAMKAFYYDRILYMPHKTCRTCLFTKPARSKHCSVCDRCIEMADHHCIWINNCVGHNNFRYFLYFLGAHLFIFSYGLWLLVPMAVKSWPLDSPPSSWGTKIWLMYRENSEAVCLAILCVFLLCITAVFTANTLYFIYLGATTNEQEKWDEIKDLIDDRDLFTYKLSPSVYRGSIVLQKLPDGLFNRKLSAFEQSLVNHNDANLILVEGFDDLNNIYDNGFWTNLKLLLFPYSTQLSKKAG